MVPNQTIQSYVDEIPYLRATGHNWSPVTHSDLAAWAAKEEKLRQIAAQAENMMQVCLDQGIKLERLFRNLNFSI